MKSAARMLRHACCAALGLLALVLAVTRFAYPLRADATSGDLHAEGSSYALTTSIEGYGSSQVSLPTGSEATFYASISVPDDVTSVSGLEVRVTIPREYLDATYYDNGINTNGSSTSESVESTSVSSDADNFYITYTLGTLTGNTTTDIPLGFKTVGSTTDGGTSFTITTELMDTDGEVVSESSLVITNSASYKLYAVGYTGHTSVGTVSSSTTSSVESEVSTVYAGVLYRTGSTETGTRTPSMIRVYVQLADGIEYNDSYTAGSFSNEGWTYDEDDGCIYRDVDVSSESSGTVYFVVKGLSQPYTRNSRSGALGSRPMTMKGTSSRHRMTRRP